MMKKIFIFYIALPLVCFASGYAFLFLNSVDLQLSQNNSNNIVSKEKRTLILTDPATQKKQILIIEAETFIDSSTTILDAKVDRDKNSSNSSYLPDVEIMKFFIQKGREGLPVLSIGNYLPFLK